MGSNGEVVKFKLPSSELWDGYGYACRGVLP